MATKRNKQPKTAIQGVSNANSTSRLKKKIRDLQRLLKKPGLQSTKQVETERALTALQYELENAQQHQQVAHMAKKYQMVRFFESKKATRKVNKAVKRLSESAGSKSAAKELKQAEVEYYYVLTFPLAAKYVSLYPKDDKELSKDERKKFEKQVAARIKAGELPTGVDADGKSRALLHGKEFNAKQQHYEERRGGAGKKTPAKEVKEGEGEGEQTNTNDQDDDEFFA